MRDAKSVVNEPNDRYSGGVPPRLVTDAQLVERLSALFRTAGYDGASIGDIALATGLQKSSLYHRFPGGKQQMAAEVAAAAGAHFATAVLARSRAMHRWPSASGPWAATSSPSTRAAPVAACSTCCPWASRAPTPRPGWPRRPRGGSARSRPRPEAGADTPTSIARAQGAVAAIEGSLVVARVTGDRRPFSRAIERLADVLVGPDPRVAPPPLRRTSPGQPIVPGVLYRKDAIHGTVLRPRVRHRHARAPAPARVPRPLRGGPPGSRPRPASETARSSSWRAATASTSPPVGANGWPYVQHRGGPAGFVRVVDPTHLAWAERSGDRQYVTAGHVDHDDRVAIIAVDYPNQQRLKLLGHARFDPEPGADLLERLGIEGRLEGLVTVEVAAFDWNCPSTSPPLHGRRGAAAVEPLHRRIQELEAALARGLDPFRRPSCAL